MSVGKQLAYCGIFLCVSSLMAFSEEKNSLPINQAQEQLVASDGKKSNELGYSVSIADNTAVLGAPYATVNSKYGQGAAYVFVRKGNGWRQVAKLTASDGTTNSFFGSSVSIYGDTIVVGADGTNSGDKQAMGAAYIFVKPSAGWTDRTQTAKLTSSDLQSNSYFGSSVSIDGDVIAVGADGASVGDSSFQGLVFLYEKPASGWASASVPNARLTASDGAKGDQLGYAVSVSGDTIVAGARSAQVSGRAAQGAAYVFVKPTGGWGNASQSAKLIASDGHKDDQFGSAVSTDADTIVVGAPGSGDGAAYVYVKAPTGWPALPSVAAKLTSSDATEGERFGAAVRVRGTLIGVGAPASDYGSVPQSGAVYLFVKPNAGWSTAKETLRIAHQNGKPEDRLGASLDIQDGAILAGAPGASFGQKYQGAGYFFDQPVASKASATEGAR